ncbi:flagellar biosynthetic protein FliO [Dendrosporobacter sp. 1207_IL3150]|uniref:flagellar biosynthetic protein FliO n=1 Tax=Dendrosporobacter sp. 1207_IL3150 TaxID=3084054 RepID=UPI002FDA34DE
MGIINKRILPICILVCVLLASSQVGAQEAQGEYLKYQEPQAPTSASWMSTISYVFSLIVTFALVIGLAYFTSKFIGQKLGSQSFGESSKVITTLSLGTNRAVYVVEIAGKCMVLGVTDHNITLLQEITDEAEIEKLRVQKVDRADQEQFSNIFQSHLASLHQITQKLPSIGSNNRTKQDNENEKR